MSDGIDLIASAGDLDPVVVTMREFIHRSGAARVVAVVDDDRPAIVDCGRLQPIEIERDERLAHLPHAIELDARPLADIPVRQLPPFDVDPENAEVAATIGGVEHLAEAVRALACAIGGQSVAMAQFDTTTAGLLFSITARGDDPIVLAIGEDEFEMEPDWP